MSLDRFIPDDHHFHAKPMNELYGVAMKEMLTPFPSVPLRSYPGFNQLTGGLRPYEFSILCGATGTGKTTACANFSRDLTEQGIPHFVASVETGATDFVKRKISSLAREDWNTGDPVGVDKTKRFHETYGSLFQSEHAWLSLYDNRLSVETLMADLAVASRDKGCKIAFIDNLNFFLEVTKAADAIVEMDRVIHSLIMFCKVVPMHVVMVMHPKKTESGRVESEFDIKGSSTAVQEAHNVFLFNRPHPDLITAGIATAGDRELKLAKMRRRGKFVGRRLILKCKDGVSYAEGEIV